MSGANSRKTLIASPSYCAFPSPDSKPRPSDGQLFSGAELASARRPPRGKCHASHCPKREPDISKRSLLRHAVKRQTRAAPSRSPRPLLPSRSRHLRQPHAAPPPERSGTPRQRPDRPGSRPQSRDSGSRRPGQPKPPAPAPGPAPARPPRTGRRHDASRPDRRRVAAEDANRQLRRPSRTYRRLLVGKRQSQRSIDSTTSATRSTGCSLWNNQLVAALEGVHREPSSRESKAALSIP
jgi:hypothetical protein